MNLLTGTPASDDARAVLEWIWAFILIPAGARSCRLVVPVRANYRPRAVGSLIALLLKRVHLLTDRALLRAIRQRSTPQ